MEWIVEYFDGTPAFTGSYEECVAWVKERGVEIMTEYAAAKKIVIEA